MANQKVRFVSSEKAFSEVVNTLFDHSKDAMSTAKDAICVLYLAKNGYLKISSEELDSYYPFFGMYSQRFQAFCGETELDEICHHHFISLNSRYHEYEEALSFENYCYSVYTHPEIEFKELEELLFWNLFDSRRNRSVRYDEYSQPKEIAHMVKWLINVKEECRVFYPFFGLGEYCGILPERSFIVGQEINSAFAELTSFLLPFKNLNGVVENVDCIEYWPNSRYDLIISTPPFGLRLDGYEHFNPDHYRTNEGWFLSKAFDSLTDNGQMICVMPAGVLSRGGEKRIREELVKRNMLDTVILLPSNLYGKTAISTTILSIRKGRSENEPVRLLDASDCYIDQHKRLRQFDYSLAIMSIMSKDVINYCEATVSEIAFMDYDLRPYLYGLKNEVPDGYVEAAIGDLADISLLRQAQTISEGRMLSAAGYDEDKFVVNVSLLPIGKIEKKVVPILKPTVLINLVNSKVIAVPEVSEEYPLCVLPNLWVSCDLKAESIDRDYFVHTFYQLHDKEKKPYLVGDAMPRFTQETLERLPLCILPNVEEQKKAVLEIKRTKLSVLAREAGLESLLKQKEEEIVRMKADYIGEVRNRKHDMKTPMTQLRNTLPLLQSLSKSLPDVAAEKLNIYIQRQKKALDVLSSIVQHIADEEVFSDPEPVEIEPILKQYEEENEHYGIVYDRDEASFEEAGIENPIISIGKVEFQRLVQNIIGNVIEHGFVDAENEEYGIHITLGIEDDDYVICFENNGEPFPDGMTKERYGTKGVKGKDSKGSGTGGYIVKSISQHYGGDFDIYTTAFAGFCNSGVIVKFPIYRNE